METFSGIANAGGASITAMAPGVAGALICTVIGLLVAIPAMFSYNFMVTSIRAITQELDGFAARYANQIEHRYVDNRPLSEELKESNDALAARIVDALKRDGAAAPEAGRIQDRRLGGCRHEEVLPFRASYADGVEHHSAAGPGVRVAGDFHHHHHAAGQ